MKVIKLHLIALVAFLPCIMIVSEDNPVINILGLLWAVLVYRLSVTKPGKKFVCSYWREIIRIENLLR